MPGRLGDQTIASVPPPAPTGPSRFYLPSPTALSRESSRHDRRPSSMSLSASASASAYASASAPVSVPTSPRHLTHVDRQRRHLRSRSSIAALRTALQTYQIPPPLEDYDHDHGHGYDYDHGHQSESDFVSELDLAGSERIYESRLGLGLRSPFLVEDGNEMMDALVDIHRVLYRGRENMDGIDGDGDGNWDTEEIRRVMERWFERDCAYDHPLVQLASRSSLSSHFQLLHLLSTLYLPKISPRALLQHSRSITSILKSRILGHDDLPGDLERVSVKGKEKALWDVEDTERSGMGRWWKVWDVRADCKEIGGMECYDGYHIALIEHTITLTILPSLSSRFHNHSISSIPSSPATYATDETPNPLRPRIPPPAFLTRLAQSLAEEFDYLLHWDLPISTFVEFNEVGKATKIRDVVDVRDAIENFVPLAKRFGWLARRVTGLLSSTIGAVVMGLVARPKVVVMQGIRVEGALAEPSSAEKIKHQYALSMGQVESDNERKSLASEGIPPDSVEGSDIGSMAPDIDDQLDN